MHIMTRVGYTLQHFVKVCIHSWEKHPKNTPHPLTKCFHGCLLYTISSAFSSYNATFQNFSHTINSSLTQSTHTSPTLHHSKLIHSFHAPRPSHHAGILYLFIILSINSPTFNKRFKIIYLHCFYSQTLFFHKFESE